MSKILYFLISFVLVLSLAGNALAQPVSEVIWDNDSGAGDRLWQTATNWDIDAVPTASDAIVIDDPYTDAADGPIIQVGIDAVCDSLEMGQASLPAVGDAVLTMTGGTLTVGDWMSVSYDVTGSARFDISDGNVNIAEDLFIAYDGGAKGTVNMTGGTMIIGQDLEIADYGSSSGTLNISAGVIDVADNIYIGWAQTGTAAINMTGGTVTCGTVTDGWFYIGGGYAPNSYLNLDGGTFTVPDIAIYPDTTLNIGGGTLIVDVDRATVPNNYIYDPCAADWNGTLASPGVVTVYGTDPGEIITDGNYPDEVGMRAVMNIDYDVTNPGKTTVTADAVDANKAWTPIPAPGSTVVQVIGVTLSWLPGENAASHEVYFGTSFADVNDANTSSDPNIYRGSQPLADVNYTVPETLVWDTTYFWRVDEVNNPTWKGIVWSVVIPPATAIEPYPADDEWYLPPDVVLHWTPGAEAVTHEVYFGTDFNDVNDATTTVDPNNVYKGPQVYGANTYDTGTLEDLLFDTYYYWRIDEVNLLVAVPRWKGDVWNFWVDYYLVVDDFEPYADTTALTAVWTTGHLTNNAAQLLLEKDPDYVRDGNNSMQFAYRCAKTGGQYRGSEAEALASALGAGTDWTIGGAQALVLYFYGDAGNAQEAQYNPSPPYHITNDQMYVALVDGSANSGIVKYDKKYNYDMNNIKEEWWHEWNIDLADPCLIAVDMNNIAKVYIGFGGAKTGQAGSGAGTKSGKFDTVWFDDIRLWPPRCRTEFVATDFTGDCITDFADVRVMSDDWLFYDYNTVAVAPSGPNLIGWWKFDEGDGNTVTDSSAYGHDGNTINPTPSWVAGYPGDPCDSAMYFDGLSDHVVCAEREGNSPGIYDANLMPDKFTIACWTKLYEFIWFSSFITNGLDTGSDECGFFLYNYGWEDESGQDFGLTITTESGLSYVETLNIYDTKRWYHLAATYDGQYATVYVDGAPAAGPTDVGGPMRWISADSDNYPRNFVIGSWEDEGYSLHVDGIIDEVRFYDYALPQGEIAILAEIVAVGVEYYQPVPSLANITDPEAKFSRKVNFRDFTIMADHWLEGPTLWP